MHSNNIKLDWSKLVGGSGLDIGFCDLYWMVVCEGGIFVSVKKF